MAGLLNGTLSNAVLLREAAPLQLTRGARSRMLDFVDPCPSSEPTLGTGTDTPSGFERQASAPRVLCVDDDLFTLSNLSRALRGRFAVVARDNPAYALSLLERDGDFAVVIVANMPEMDTLELLEMVRERSPTTARIVLRANASVASTSERSHSAFRVLARPFSTDQLVRTVDEAVRFHTLLSASPAQPVETPDSMASWPPTGSSALAQQAESASTREACSSDSPISANAPPPRALVTMPGGSTRIGLRLAGRIIELLPGLTIVGRSPTCHIVIDSAGVSRRHLCFSNDGDELTLRRNVGDASQVLVNGIAIRGEESFCLEVGDSVSVGSQEIEVCRLGDYSPSPESTAPGPVAGGEPAPTREAASLRARSNLASRYLRLGQSREAERLLRPSLEGLLRYCRSGQTPLPSDARLAVELALCMAELNQAGAWLTYVFDLLAVLGIAPEEGVLERLQQLVPRIPGVSVASYRTYADRLAQLEERFGLAQQRRLVRRVLELENAIVGSFLAASAAQRR